MTNKTKQLIQRLTVINRIKVKSIKAAQNPQREHDIHLYLRTLTGGQHPEGTHWRKEGARGRTEYSVHRSLPERLSSTIRLRHLPVTSRSCSSTPASGDFRRKKTKLMKTYTTYYLSWQIISLPSLLDWAGWGKRRGLKWGLITINGTYDNISLKLIGTVYYGSAFDSAVIMMKISMCISIISLLNQREAGQWKKRTSDKTKIIRMPLPTKQAVPVIQLKKVQNQRS